MLGILWSSSIIYLMLFLINISQNNVHVTHYPSNRRNILLNPKLYFIHNYLIDGKITNFIIVIYLNVIQISEKSETIL